MNNLKDFHQPFQLDFLSLEHKREKFSQEKRKKREKEKKEAAKRMPKFLSSDNVMREILTSSIGIKSTNVTQYCLSFCLCKFTLTNNFYRQWTDRSLHITKPTELGSESTYWLPCKMQLHTCPLNRVVRCQVTVTDGLKLCIVCGLCVKQSGSLGKVRPTYKIYEFIYADYS